MQVFSCSDLRNILHRVVRNYEGQRNSEEEEDSGIGVSGSNNSSYSDRNGDSSSSSAKRKRNGATAGHASDPHRSGRGFSSDRLSENIDGIIVSAMPFNIIPIVLLPFSTSVFVVSLSYILFLHHFIRE